MSEDNEEFGFFMMKIEPDTKEKLRKLAESAQRSMSAQVRFWILDAWDKRVCMLESAEDLTGASEAVTA